VVFGDGKEASAKYALIVPMIGKVIKTAYPIPVGFRNVARLAD
jgi:hypothetical protein